MEVIEKEEIIFIDELIAFIPISERTFYNWKLQELQELKGAINKQKVLSKTGLRKDWRFSQSHVLQLALYRLLATEEERRLLATNYTDVTTKGESVNAPVMITMAEAKKRLEALDEEI